ncbi:hypothetical protein PIB30_085540 [Stylosanthes scabra]|uniref:Putative plant transposon protein domain-containing protein n=1 Tax=Stylosanthes scabra TaxID=79078 RepID=A0ABU6XU00_9FABA|nr:hypothetical protein [Stylosanthes scabra]
MSRRGKDIATGTSTPSRVRTSKNSNRERGEGFPSNRFDYQLHYDRWKGLENRQIVHERIIHLDGDEERIFRERVFGLGWGFISAPIFSSGQQEHVFLRGKKIPFTEDNIRRHLGIHGESSDAEVDDDFVALAKAYERGDDMDMAEIFSVIGQEGTNWANNPAINTVPKSLNNAILNPRATAWHKIIVANMDPKTHGTNFDMKHALLIYVLMTQGWVNLPRMMRDILLVHLTKHPRNLLPYPVLISRLAHRYEVPEFPNDAFYIVRDVKEVDMYVPFGDWRGERVRGSVRPHRQPPPQDQPAEPLPQPETSATPSAPAQYSLEPTMHDIMWRLDRQDRQIARTQAMIRRAFPSVDFTGLGFSSSSDDSGESQGF